MATRRVDADPLLERTSELEALEESVAAVRLGSGGALLIEGSAGLGKTRLLAAAVEQARRAGMTVLTARATELEGDFAWGVVRQLFERTLFELPDEERAAALADAAERAAPALGLTTSGGAAQEASFTTLHGLYWLTANLARRGPLLLAVDDAHWADGPSLRYLAFLAARLDGLPVLAAVTARPGEGASPVAREVLARIGTDPTLTLLRPAPLSPPASAELVRGRMGEAGDEFCWACHEVSGGNPFLLRELAGELAEEGVAPTGDAAERVRRTTPEVVTRSVLLRLARLSADAVAMARAIAILTPPVELHRAARLAGVDRDSAAPLAGLMVAANVLEDEPELQFVHPILRSAVLDDTAATERAHLHRRAAELLEAEGAPVEEVATHLLSTAPSRDDRVVARLREAAALALESGAPEVAIACLRRALAEPPDEGARPEVLFELGAAEAVDDTASACEHLTEAVQLTGGPRRRVEMSLELGRTLNLAGRPADAAEVLERAIHELGDDGSPLAAELESELMNSRWDLSIRPRTLRLYEKLKERAAREKELDPRLHSQIAIELSAAGRDREAALWHARKALSAAELMESEGSATLPQTVSVLVHANLLDEARTLGAALLRGAQRRGWPLVTAIMANICALVAIWSGSVSDAIAYAHESLSPTTEAWMPPFAVAFLVEALWQRGEVDTARAELDRRGLDRELPPIWQFTAVLFYRARVWAAGGDHRRAVDDLLRCGELCTAFGAHNPAFFPWRSTAALSLVALGERDRALILAREELDLAEAWGTSCARGIALRGVGNAEEDGAETLRQAVRELERSESPLELAHAVVDLGATLRRAGERGEARERLRRGLDVAHRQGALALAERAREELVVAGGRPRRNAMRGRDALTPSELRVARMAASGLTNRQIAQALFVTLRTVEVHLTSTYGKLGIASRKELAGALGA